MVYLNQVEEVLEKVLVTAKVNIEEYRPVISGDI